MTGPVKVRIRDRVADQLVLRNAISPDSAVAFVPDGRFERWLFARRRRSGAIVEAAPGRFYLDVPVYHAEATGRERRWLASAVVAIILALLSMLLYR